LETSFDSVIVPEVVSKVADTTTAPSPDFTVTKSIGAPAENEIVVPRFPSTLGPATGDAQETLGLSTVRTLSGSPWLASASPEMLSPASTTIAMTKMRAAFGLPRRRCLAIRLYLLLCAATCWIPRHLQDKRNNRARRTGTCCARAWVLTGQLGAASGLFLATSPGVVAEDSGEPENAASAPGRRRYNTPAHA